jgi:hypothetical protein
VESGHDFDRPGLRRRRDEVGLHGGRENSGADRLGQDECISSLHARIGQYPPGMNEPRHGKTELDFRIFNAVSSHKNGAGFMNLLQASPENLLQNVLVHGLDGKTHHVHGRNRPSSHGVDVAQRIGRRNAPEIVWIIDDGRDEVESLHQGQIVGQTINPRVVGSLPTHQEVGVALERQLS